MMNPSRRFQFSPWPVVMTMGAIALAVSVFIVTQGVQQREARVAELNRQLLSEQQTLRVLDAEWAYLTRPQRLETLMAMKTDHTDMPPAPAPIATVVPVPHSAKVEADSVAAPVSAPVPQKIEPAAGVTAAAAPKKAGTSSAKATKPAAVKPRAKAAPVAAAAPAAKKKHQDDLVWSPKRNALKSSAQRPMPVRAAGYTPPRAGVARPIVE